MGGGVFPHNYEELLDFNVIRTELGHLCQNEVGLGLVERMTFLPCGEQLALHLGQLSEMMHLVREGREVPGFGFSPLRDALVAIRPDGTYLTVAQAVALRQMLSATYATRQLFKEQEVKDSAPELYRLAEKLDDLPEIRKSLQLLLDDEGEIKDSASSVLREIRQEIRRLRSSVSGTMQSVLRQAQKSGFVATDATPVIRDGRLLLPIIPAAKRELPGIVHEQSSTGQTLYLEPMQLVQLNNDIKEKEGEELREIVRLLKEFSSHVRSKLRSVQQNVSLLGVFDFVRAKERLAHRMEAIVPEISLDGSMEWQAARHPLLEKRLREEGRQLVPLSLRLSKEKRILVISGPNAGGKSVALKTVGLIQYMLQCGLAVPMLSHSSCTFFDQLLLDIGDQQSMDNDLSTYSSHLQAMKYFISHATSESLVLIDEFGAGTEPTIGGAIAEGVLSQFCKIGTYGVITTHYGNLKEFAEKEEALLNGAMLFDRGQLKPLYELYVGQPGSSFGIEIARKIGLSEEVLTYAEEKIGTDYMLQDKYLQDIMRDKAYWSRKRQKIRKEEKALEKKQERLDERLASFSEKREQLLKKAHKEALQIVSGANAAVEQTIREIKEGQAEKEATQKARRRLMDEKKQLEQHHNKKREKKTQPKSEISVGSAVRLEDGNVVGEVLAIKGKKAQVRMGNLTMTLPLERLHPTAQATTAVQKSKPKEIADQADERKLNFKPQIDCRGMRVDEALQAVTHFLDDAVHFGYSPVRILHGTGTGALKEAIAHQLQNHRDVRAFKDEHVDFGGAGITVVELKS